VDKFPREFRSERLSIGVDVIEC